MIMENRSLVIRWWTVAKVLDQSFDGLMIYDDLGHGPLTVPILLVLYYTI